MIAFLREENRALKAQWFSSDLICSGEPRKQGETLRMAKGRLQARMSALVAPSRLGAAANLVGKSSPDSGTQEAGRFG